MTLSEILPNNIKWYQKIALMIHHFLYRFFGKYVYDMSQYTKLIAFLSSEAQRSRGEMVIKNAPNARQPTSDTLQSDRMSKREPIGNRT